MPKNNNHWTAKDIPDQTGHVAIVTGSNSGIGYETARWLAAKGAHVVIASRNLEKCQQSAADIKAQVPACGLEVIPLDLADLDSIRTFAATYKERHDRLDLLINNAGVMMPPCGQTQQGFETQFGVNHLGHFALTALLLDTISRTPGARIVTLTSLFYLFGRIDFGNLNAEKRYRRRSAYSQSKLANLLFTNELQRKLSGAGIEAIAVSAHPGWTKTNLQRHSDTLRFLNRFFSQEQEMGVLPTLYAATAPGIQGCDFIEPERRFGLLGYPKKSRSNGRSHDQAVAAQLWAVSEEMTRIPYSL